MFPDSCKVSTVNKSPSNPSPDATKPETTASSSAPESAVPGTGPARKVRPQKILDWEVLEEYVRVVVLDQIDLTPDLYRLNSWRVRRYYLDCNLDLN